MSHISTATLGQRSLSKKKKKITSPAVEIFHCVVCLDSIVNKPTLPPKLIQMRAEDNQIWNQIQNPMPSPRLHTSEPIEVVGLLLT